MPLPCLLYKQGDFCPVDFPKRHPRLEHCAPSDN